MIFQVEIILRCTCGLTLRKYTLYHRLACLSARNTWLPLSMQQENAPLRFKCKHIWCNKPICCLYWPSYTNSPAVCQYQWPRGLRSGYAAARLLRLWVRIQPGHGGLSLLSVLCCQVEVSSSGLITPPEESYRLWRVWVVMVKSRWWGGPGPLGASAPSKKKTPLQFASMDSPCDQMTHIEAKTSLYKILTDAYFSPKGSIQTTHISTVDTTSNHMCLNVHQGKCMADSTGVNIFTL